MNNPWKKGIKKTLRVKNGEHVQFVCDSGSYIGVILNGDSNGLILNRMIIIQVKEFLKIILDGIL
jgi:hypothetical protein